MNYDTKGKFFTNVITKDAVPARIQTLSHLIEGEIHIRRECRLKDELDHEEPFLAVTNATLYATDGQVLFQTKFIAVRRDQVIWVTTLDDIEKGDSSC